MLSKKELKKYWNKFWFLLWKDDSFKGWLFSVIFIFIFIKFIFFPILGVVTGTALPLAIVESCSMYHQGNLISNHGEWFDRHENKYLNLGISKESFKEFWFKNGLNKGDILFVIGTKAEKIDIGDVVIFNAAQRNPIIHRIVEVREENGNKIFSTIGDNNNGQLEFEKRIPSNQIIGKPVLKIAPYVGWIKLIFFEKLKPNSDRGFCNEL